MAAYVIEFPSLDAIKAWYASPDYQQVKELRAGAATTLLTAIAGC